MILKEYDEMAPDRKVVLKEWIGENFKPRKTINRKHSSYGLKHTIQSDTRFYCSNDEFKGAMLEMGFFPDDTSKVNWCFNISEKSVNDTCNRIWRRKELLGR